MRKTSLIACLALLLPSLALAELPKKAPAEPEGMKVLFNGKDLTGWDGDPSMWSVRDGVIHGETTPENPCKRNTFLIWTGGKTGDFELRLSYRCNAVNNSGIQYRSRHVTEGTPANPWIVVGYQHELRNEVKFPNVPSFIYDEGGKRGRLVNVGEEVVWTAEGKKVVSNDIVTQEEFEKIMKLDDWNDVVIIAKGNHIRHYLNGHLMIDFKDEHPELKLLDGVLALQLHAGKPMWTEFKNIRFKEIK